MGLALLYPNLEGVDALTGLRTRLLGFKGCRDMQGSRLVASCTTWQQTVPASRQAYVTQPAGQRCHVNLESAIVAPSLPWCRCGSRWCLIATAATTLCVI
jgi:hypothetical protein